MIEQLWFAARHGMLPPWYYMFEMFDPAQQAKAPHYIHRYELKNGLLQILRRSVPAARRSPTQNKIAFLKRCAKAGIRTLPNLAIVKAGKLQLQSVTRDQLLAQDLFVKPARGRGGEGAGLWRLSERRSIGCRMARRCRRRHLLQASARSCRRARRCWCSRARATIPPSRTSATAPCAPRASSPCAPRPAAMKRSAPCSAWRSATTAWSTISTPAASPRRSTSRPARLGAATDWGLRPRHGWKSHHPDTGGLIEGRVLPLWAETRALAERAHAAFADRHIIGWDMAILEDGPAIVEANGGPDTDMHQRVSRDPLGNQRFGELMAFHLRGVRRTNEAHGDRARFA